ncbi:MAG: vWA domain-containing protein [bacterium]
MTFIHPAFLWALPFAAAPIVIYLLLRYRSLRVVWGANYVLERALERLRRRLYLEQLLLLAVRVLACAALVLAFARPASRAASPLATATGVHRILAVDGSYSMLAGRDGATRWDRAVDAMKNLVATWGRGETWSLCLVGEETEWIVEAKPVGAPGEADATLEALAPRETAIELAEVVADILARFPREPIEVYLVADDQAPTWEGMERLALPVGSQAAIFWIHPPLETRENLAVTSVRVPNERVLVGHPCRLFVAVRNYGTAAANAALELLVDGAFADKQDFAVLPGQEVWLRFDAALDRPGPHYVTARLGTDALAFDNALSAGLEAADRLSVAVLRDAAAKGKFDSAWGFLEIAGRVQKTVDADGRPVFPMGRIDFSLVEGECTADVLVAFDAVLLDGGRTVTQELAAVLSSFVRRGGSLVATPDESVDAAAWNAMLGGAGLLPAELGKLHVEALGGERFHALAQADSGGPAPMFFESDANGDIGEARFYTWHDLREVDEAARVRARFADGQPFLVRERAGAGSVVLAAAGLSGRGNNLIVREFLVPFVFWVFSEAVSAAMPPRTVGLGEPIRVHLPATQDVDAASLHIEGWPPVPLAPQRAGDDLLLAAPEGSPRSGLCSILVTRDGGSSRVWFGVQGERVDSDLRPLAPEAKEKVFEKLGIVEAGDWAELDEILAARRRGAEWHHGLILALLALLAAEMVIQRRFV